MFGILFTTRQVGVGESRKNVVVTHTVLPMNKQWQKEGECYLHSMEAEIMENKWITAQ